MARFEEARFSLAVAKLLRLAKRLYSYRVLSEATGVPAPQLSRYVTGRSLPSPEKASEILRGLRRLVDPRRALAERLAETGGLVDTSAVLAEPLYLYAAVLDFAERFRGLDATRIIVPEASGIPLAAALSLEMEIPFIVARRGPIKGWLCSSGPAVFCIPRGSLGRVDRVLVVDDIVETGRTLAAVKELVEATGARLVGVAALVVIGEEWREAFPADNVEAVMKLTKGVGRLPGL